MRSSTFFILLASALCVSASALPVAVPQDLGSLVDSLSGTDNGNDNGNDNQNDNGNDNQNDNGNGNADGNGNTNINPNGVSLQTQSRYIAT